MAGPGNLTLAALAILALAGCAAQSQNQQNPSQQANLAACTAQADAAYDQNNLNALGRTNQNGLFFTPMPQSVFDGQRMGTENSRYNQIQDCMANGDPDKQLPNQAPLPAPHVITQPQ